MKYYGSFYADVSHCTFTGMSFVKAIRVYYCKLCLLNVKEGAVEKHCVTASHREKYFTAKKRVGAVGSLNASFISYLRKLESHFALNNAPIYFCYLRHKLSVE